ncbi:hypothetical protein Q5752_003916 [Cryptotrichosporon argae]
MFAISSLRASTSRAVRTLSTSRPARKAALKASAEAPTPAELLAKIGRGADKKLASHAESWGALNAVWTRGGRALEAAGLGVKERRYILWALSRFSQGSEPSTFVAPPTPAKKYRGWGPRVQNGKRVR